MTSPRVRSTITALFYGSLHDVPSALSRGSLDPTEIPLLLLSLQGEQASGRLRVNREGIARDLFLKQGWLVDAESSAPTDALEWLLFGAGMLTEDRLGHVKGLIGSGVKRGRALIEIGAITPAVLCEWTERRVSFLARDTMGWRKAECLFDAAACPPPGAILVRLDARALALASLREGGAAMLSSRLPSPDDTPVPAAETASGLAPHESYVLSLADGQRRVSEICFLSEIGETETLKTLALLEVAGALAMGGSAAALSSRPDEPAAAREPGASPIAALEVPAGETQVELRAAIRIYNDVYAFLCAHLIKEVGPIAEQLLDKNLRDVRDQHAALFARIVPGRDGGLPEDHLMRNLASLRDVNRREALLVALHDYLKAMVVAVRRILGPEQEAHVLRRLKDMRCSRA